MDGKPSYFKTGLFVIVGVLLITVAVVALGAGLFERDQVVFETYFDSSVSGLDVGAAVEDRGVKRGEVKKITFVASEYDLPDDVDRTRYQRYVLVTGTLDTKANPEMSERERKQYIKKMVEKGYRLRLASNLLTNRAYLEGVFLDPNRYPVTQPEWKPENLFIPSAPGELTTIKSSINRILYKLEKLDTERIGLAIEKLLETTQKAVDDANVPAISGELENLLSEMRQTNETVAKLVTTANKAVEDANVPALSQEVQSLFAEARKTNQRLEQLLAPTDPNAEPESVATTIARLNAMLEAPEGKQRSANIALAVSRLNASLKSIERLLSTREPQIEQVLDNFRRASENLRELTENLKRNPGQLFFGKPPRQSEVLE